jgi:hypothetical protein
MVKNKIFKVIFKTPFGLFFITLNDAWKFDDLYIVDKAVPPFPLWQQFQDQLFVF